MGIFGDTDASEIPDDPFYVEPGTYTCVITEAVVRNKKNSEEQGLSLTYVIQDEDSDYKGSRVQEWKNVWPNVENAQQRQDNARVKQRLLSLGVPEAVMNDDPAEFLETLKGVECYVTVKESVQEKDGVKRTFTNVTYTSVPDSE